MTYLPLIKNIIYKILVGLDSAKTLVRKRIGGKETMILEEIGSKLNRILLQNLLNNRLLVMSLSM